MDTRKVYTESEQFDQEFLQSFQELDSGYELAERLINKRIVAKKESVTIDHLGFTFPLSSLRHCHKAGFAGFTSKSQPYFPLPPKVDVLEGKDAEEIQAHLLHVKSQLAEFYVETLKVFVDHVLGFSVEAPRGKGFHGYKDSMTMRSSNGVEVGFIGIGGQNDTAYFQITGQGCKHLFSKSSPFRIHHWLHTVLGITHLSRIDLASDDYDGNFDCDYAETAYLDGAFRTGKGGKMPVIKPCHEYVYNEKRQKVFDVEMIAIGKRTSPVYWRIYNKKLEQGLDDENLSWYRNEVELKKWNVDCLLDVDAAFAGICAFAQSMEKTQGIRTKSMTKAKVACLDVASRVKWFRHSAGKALGDILEAFEGDLEKAFGLLLPDDTGQKLGIPPTYQKLINHVTEI
ncbi:replication initiation factor domain-containing protein [Thalassotalea sp. PLHSN55]|uniref:replication initiation factor domain-containing protein n=1 Tax=Thalassotalea sp. PLHSN55 TaxID=3435888 RepID=UPI003F87A107